MDARALGPALLLLALAVFAGCVADPVQPTKHDTSRQVAAKRPIVYTPETIGRTLAHTAANVSLDPESVFPILPSVSYVSVGKRGPEPSIGVTKNGMIFFQAIEG